ncbi:hypothetical protein PL321_02940 [Caloramator sp. mosi_1]|nr:hypothetical protein [Caloramator sp. mosi_1]WDC84669.1 hypothetical protein PL321_02940 [Caloramator sp. mosi_1]
MFSILQGVRSTSAPPNIQVIFPPLNLEEEFIVSREDKIAR